MTDNIFVSTDTRPALTIAHQPAPVLTLSAGRPWHEVVLLGFQLLAARAVAGDEEIAGYLTENKATVFAPDGSKLWPV